MLQNTNQRRDEDDWAKHVEEEEGETFFTHIAKHEVGAFGGIFEQMIKEPSEALHEAETDGGVQEEPRQQQFDHQKLYDKTKTDAFTIVADQQGQHRYHH